MSTRVERLRETLKIKYSKSHKVAPSKKKISRKDPIKTMEENLSKAVSPDDVPRAGHFLIIEHYVKLFNQLFPKFFRDELRDSNNISASLFIDHWKSFVAANQKESWNEIINEEREQYDREVLIKQMQAQNYMSELDRIEGQIKKNNAKVVAMNEVSWNKYLDDLDRARFKLEAQRNVFRKQLGEEKYEQNKRRFQEVIRKKIEEQYPNKDDLSQAEMDRIFNDYLIEYEAILNRHADAHFEKYIKELSKQKQGLADIKTRIRSTENDIQDNKEQIKRIKKALEGTGRYIFSAKYYDPHPSKETERLETELRAYQDLAEDLKATLEILEEKRDRQEASIKELESLYEEDYGDWKARVQEVEAVHEEKQMAYEEKEGKQGETYQSGDPELEKVLDQLGVKISPEDFDDISRYAGILRKFNEHGELDKTAKEKLALYIAADEDNRNVLYQDTMRELQASAKQGTEIVGARKAMVAIENNGGKDLPGGIKQSLSESKEFIDFATNPSQDASKLRKVLEALSSLGTIERQKYLIEHHLDEFLVDPKEGIRKTIEETEEEEKKGQVLDEKTAVDTAKRWFHDKWNESGPGLNGANMLRAIVATWAKSAVKIKHPFSEGRTKNAYFWNSIDEGAQNKMTVGPADGRQTKVILYKGKSPKELTDKLDAIYTALQDDEDVKNKYVEYQGPFNKLEVEKIKQEVEQKVEAKKEKDLGDRVKALNIDDDDDDDILLDSPEVSKETPAQGLFRKNEHMSIKMYPYVLIAKYGNPRQQAKAREIVEDFEDAIDSKLRCCPAHEADEILEERNLLHGYGLHDRKYYKLLLGSYAAGNDNKQIKKLLGL